VGLAGIDGDFASGIFTVAVDYVFAAERVVLVKWLVGPKAIRVDGE
jgi:hypothetical protein